MAPGRCCVPWMSKQTAFAGLAARSRAAHRPGRTHTFGPSTEPGAQAIVAVTAPIPLNADGGLKSRRDCAASQPRVRRLLPQQRLIQSRPWARGGPGPNRRTSCGSSTRGADGLGGPPQLPPGAATGAPQEGANGGRSDTSQAAGGSSARVAADRNSRATKRTAGLSTGLEHRAPASQRASGSATSGARRPPGCPSAARPARQQFRPAPRTQQQRHSRNGRQMASWLGPVPDPWSRPHHGQSLGATA